MRILVTGGAGFIGSQIVDAYLERGHEVTILDNLSTGKKENINPRATFCQVDVRDAKAVADVLASRPFDVVNHHAAQMDVRRSVADPAYDASVNIIGVLNLLEACVRTNVKKVLFASSGGAIYGEHEYFPADEAHPTNPISPYGVAKLTTEHYLFYYAAVHGLASIALRYANIYGPRQNPEGEAGVVAIFASRMLRGEAPIINGDGKQTRDYVFVGDVVRANVLALDYQGSGVFNVGTGRESDVNLLFQIIRRSSGAQCPEQHGPAKRGEQLRSVLNNARIKSVLGWEPTVTLEVGLDRTVEFFRQAARGGASR
jgi:UDP-glucose 4-epimerase